MAAGWRLGLVSVVSCLVLSGCGGGTEPTVPSQLLLNTSSFSFTAFGQTRQLTVLLFDQRGNALRDVPITWKSDNEAIATVSADGLVTAHGVGTTQVEAAVGELKATAQVRVTQTPARLAKISGDLQTDASGSTLANPLIVEVRDANENPIAGAAVTFAVTLGDGDVSVPSATTDADGRASTIFTLGRRSGEQDVTAAAGGAAPLVFVATAVPGPPAQITIFGGNNLQAPPGGVIAPSVQVTDALGNGIPNFSVTWQVTAGGGTVVTGSGTATNTTDPDGVSSAQWTLGALGQNRVTATAVGASLTGSPVTFVATATNAPPSAYNIELRFLTPASPAQLQAFSQAELRWEQHVTGDLNDIPVNVAAACGGSTPALNETIDDLLILVQLEPIDGPGKVLGAAGPCLIRTSNGLPLVGMMRLDTDDLAELEANGLLRDVILHEMGHVLGIGSLWEQKGLLVDPKRTGGTDPHFIGAQALTAFNAAGGVTYVATQKVPVEDQGGNGTADSHWRESVFDNELMTGYVNLDTNPLSAITLRSLQDLGYTIDASGADPFTLTGAFRVGPPAPSIRLREDVRHGPVFKVDRQGRITDVLMR